MVFKQSGHCISFSWVVSWTICTGFLHYELSNIACMEQECKVAPLFEVLVDFLDSLRVTRKMEWVYKLYWMEHCHRNLLCPLFIVFFFWKWILFVRMYGNDLCQTKEDELGAKYQPDPLSSQLQSWPELVFRVPPLFCLLSCIFSGSVRQCTWKENSKRA